MSDRKKFTPQFKADAVALVLSSGRPIAQVAPEIGVVEVPDAVVHAVRGPPPAHRPQVVLLLLPPTDPLRVELVP